MSTVTLDALGEAPKWDRTYKALWGVVGAATMAILVLLTVVTLENHGLERGQKTVLHRLTTVLASVASEAGDEQTVLNDQVKLLSTLDKTIKSHSQTLALLTAQETQLTAISNTIHQEIVNGHTSTVALLDQLTTITQGTKDLLTAITAEENAGVPVLEEFRADVILLENTQKVIQAELSAICTSVHCSAHAG